MARTTELCPHPSVAHCTVAATTDLIVYAGMLACSGQDIFKRSSHRKAKFLFAFCGRVAPLVGSGNGKLGMLSNLDTANPICYMEFPQVGGCTSCGCKICMSYSLAERQWCAYSAWLLHDC